MRTSYSQMSGSGQIFAGEGWLSDMYVTSTSSGAIIIVDSLTYTNEGAAVYKTITPTIGYYNLGNKHFTTGCYMNALSGSLQVTFGILESD